MKKLKTHSSTKKRVKKTATGKFLFKKACNNHLLTNKKKKRNKSFPYGIIVATTEMKKIKKLLPYR